MRKTLSIHFYRDVFKNLSDIYDGVSAELVNASLPLCGENDRNSEPERALKLGGMGQ